MHRVVLRVAVFLVVATLTYLLETLAVVVIAGEVSCYEVCSPTTEILEAAAPWPLIAACTIALSVGGLASLLGPQKRP